MTSRLGVMALLTRGAARVRANLGLVALDACAYATGDGTQQSPAIASSVRAIALDLSRLIEVSPEREASAAGYPQLRRRVPRV